MALPFMCFKTICPKVEGLKGKFFIKVIFFIDFEKLGIHLQDKNVSHQLMLQDHRTSFLHFQYFNCLFVFATRGPQ